MGHRFIYFEGIHMDMRRKVIKQRDSFTMTLPMPWVKQHAVDKHLEIDVEMEGEHLLMSASSVASKQGKVSIPIDNEAFVRYVLNNAYRSGYDRLEIELSPKAQKYVEAHLSKLLGWKIVRRTENRLVLENLAEPRAERFESLLRRNFYVLQESLLALQSYWDKGTSVESIKIGAEEVSTTDNFLRRCISKRVVDNSKTYFYWQFISTISWVYRAAYFASQEPRTNDRQVQAMLSRVITSFKDLHTGFFEKNLSRISQSFEVSRAVLKAKPKIKDARSYHYVMEMARMLNLSCSPGVGICV